MLKFFRSIRKKLIEEDKVGKYLLNAIGEILLVVIGILIALQVNNWNQDRQLRTQEVAVLQSLLGDLNRASGESNRLLLQEREFEKNINRLIDPAERQSLLDDDSLEVWIYNALIHINMEIPVIQTYNDLTNSGETGLISNDRIRSALMDLEVSLQELQRQTDDNMLVQQMGLDQVIQNNVNPVLGLVNINMLPLGSMNRGELSELLDEVSVINGMITKAWLNSDLINDRGMVDQKIKDLIALIEEELT